jgi:hypothetical protein
VAAILRCHVACNVASPEVLKEVFDRLPRLRRRLLDLPDVVAVLQALAHFQAQRPDIADLMWERLQGFGIAEWRALTPELAHTLLRALAMLYGRANPGIELALGWLRKCELRAFRDRTTAKLLNTIARFGIEDDAMVQRLFLRMTQFMGHQIDPDQTVLLLEALAYRHQRPSRTAEERGLLPLLCQRLVALKDRPGWTPAQLQTLVGAIETLGVKDPAVVQAVRDISKHVAFELGLPSRIRRPLKFTIHSWTKKPLSKKQKRKKKEEDEVGWARVPSPPPSRPTWVTARRTAATGKKPGGGPRPRQGPQTPTSRPRDPPRLLASQQHP